MSHCLLKSITFHHEKKKNDSTFFFRLQSRYWGKTMGTSISFNICCTRTNIRDWLHGKNGYGENRQRNCEDCYFCTVRPIQDLTKKKKYTIKYDQWLGIRTEAGCTSILA